MVIVVVSWLHYCDWFARKWTGMTKNVMIHHMILMVEVAAVAAVTDRFHRTMWEIVAAIAVAGVTRM